MTEEKKKTLPEIEGRKKPKQDKKQAAEAEAKQKADEEAQRRAKADAKRVEDEQKKLSETDAKKKAEQPKKQTAEAEAKQKDDEKAKRKVEADARKVEQEKKKLSEVDAKKKGDQDKKKTAEAEATTKTDEEAQRKAETDIKKVEGEKNKAVTDAKQKTDESAKSSQPSADVSASLSVSSIAIESNVPSTIKDQQDLAPKLDAGEAIYQAEEIRTAEAKQKETIKKQREVPFMQVDEPDKPLESDEPTTSISRDLAETSTPEVRPEHTLDIQLEAGASVQGKAKQVDDEDTGFKTRAEPKALKRNEKVKAKVVEEPRQQTVKLPSSGEKVSGDEPIRPVYVTVQHGESEPVQHVTLPEAVQYDLSPATDEDKHRRSVTENETEGRHKVSEDQPPKSDADQSQRYTRRSSSKQLVPQEPEAQPEHKSITLKPVKKPSSAGTKPEKDAYELKHVEHDAKEMEDSELHARDLKPISAAEEKTPQPMIRQHMPKDSADANRKTADDEPGKDLKGDARQRRLNTETTEEEKSNEEDAGPSRMQDGDHQAKKRRSKKDGAKPAIAQENDEASEHAQHKVQMHAPDDRKTPSVAADESQDEPKAQTKSTDDVNKKELTEYETLEQPTGETRKEKNVIKVADTAAPVKPTDAAEGGEAQPQTDVDETKLRQAQPYSRRTSSRTFIAVEPEPEPELKTIQLKPVKKVTKEDVPPEELRRQLREADVLEKLIELQELEEHELRSETDTVERPLSTDGNPESALAGPVVEMPKHPVPIAILDEEDQSRQAHPYSRRRTSKSLIPNEPEPETGLKKVQLKPVKLEPKTDAPTEHLDYELTHVEKETKDVPEKAGDEVVLDLTAQDGMDKALPKRPHDGGPSIPEEPTKEAMVDDSDEVSSSPHPQPYSRRTSSKSFIPKESANEPEHKKIQLKPINRQPTTDTPAELLEYKLRHVDTRPPDVLEGSERELVALQTPQHVDNMNAATFADSRQPEIKAGTAKQQTAAEGADVPTSSDVDGTKSRQAQPYSRKNLFTHLHRSRARA
ncbi:hypothetical protein AAVH_10045 [Aphelenchoides avenae]|nr:hypothetical protein AAVH_10045 [Aphelenchus avenae]